MILCKVSLILIHVTYILYLLPSKLLVSNTDWNLFNYNMGSGPISVSLSNGVLENIFMGIRINKICILNLNFFYISCYFYYRIHLIVWVKTNNIFYMTSRTVDFCNHLLWWYYQLLLLNVYLWSVWR